MMENSEIVACENRRPTGAAHEELFPIRTGGLVAGMVMHAVGAGLILGCMLGIPAGLSYVFIDALRLSGQVPGGSKDYVYLSAVTAIISLPLAAIGVYLLYFFVRESLQWVRFRGGSVVVDNEGVAVVRDQAVLVRIAWSGVRQRFRRSSLLTVNYEDNRHRRTLRLPLVFFGKNDRERLWARIKSE